MRVFLCSFDVFLLAIPMPFISSLALQTEDSEQFEQNTYVSLPELFKLPRENIRHSIALKNHDGEDEEAAVNKTILLSPEVESEIEIYDEEIHPIPKALNSTDFFKLFSGIKFSAAGGAPILLLNPEPLINRLQKETSI